MGYISGMLLGFKIVLCDHNLLLVTAELDIIKRHFGNKADLDVANILNCGLYVGSCRLDVAAYAAEQVEFPHSIQSGLIKISICRLSGIVLAECNRW